MLHTSWFVVNCFGTLMAYCNCNCCADNNKYVKHLLLIMEVKLVAMFVIIDS
jgi:hypothetical protein